MAVAKIVFLCSEVTAVSTYFIKPIYERLGFSGGSDGKKSTCNERDLGLIPGLGKIPWRRELLPTPVFWPGESQRWGSLVGCRLWGRTELDMTEATWQQQQQQQQHI